MKVHNYHLLGWSGKNSIPVPAPNTDTYAYAKQKAAALVSSSVFSCIRIFVKHSPTKWGRCLKKYEFKQGKFPWATSYSISIKRESKSKK